MILLSAIILCSFIAATGYYLNFNQDRSYYPTILIFIALLYVLFGVMDGRPSIIMKESVIASFFVAGALIGSVKSYTWIALLLILHGIFDFFHPQIISNVAVPTWWPLFCLYVDVLLGSWVFLLDYMGKFDERAG
ncbi:MAG: hypothetical protein R3220_10820 [Balneolaceae bacterium]|nr:hypothetical protein [Balneolaceae bacterium]